MIDTISYIVFMFLAVCFICLLFTIPDALCRLRDWLHKRSLNKTNKTVTP